MEAGSAKTYKIGQAAKLLDVKPFVLRFWEGEFREALVPVRTPSGQRAYTEGNLDTVRRIKRLLYEEGLTIEGAKKRLLAAPEQESAPATAPIQVGQVGQVGQASQMDQSAAQATLLPSAPAAHADKSLLRDIAQELSALRDLLR